MDRVKEVELWWMYFVFVYENRTQKLVEIILRRWEEGLGKTMEGMNLIKIYCKHICKSHNVSPCTIIIC
jgi:hypothetical protein